MKSLAWFLLTLAFLLVTSILVTTYVTGFDAASGAVGVVLLIATLKMVQVCWKGTWN